MSVLGYTSGGGSALITLTTPTCSEGDLLVAVWSIRSTARSPLLPDGWSWVLASFYTGANMRDAALIKVADAADAAGATHNFALSDYGVTHSVSFVTVASGSLDGAAHTDYSSVSTDRAAGPVTPSGATSLLLHMATWRGTATYTEPGSPGTWAKAGQENSTTTGTAIASAPYNSTDPTGVVTGTLSAAATGAAYLLVVPASGGTDYAVEVTDDLGATDEAFAAIVTQLADDVSATDTTAATLEAVASDGLALTDDAATNLGVVVDDEEGLLDFLAVGLGAQIEDDLALLDSVYASIGLTIADELGLTDDVIPSLMRRLCLETLLSDAEVAVDLTPATVTVSMASADVTTTLSTAGATIAMTPANVEVDFGECP